MIREVKHEEFMFLKISQFFLYNKLRNFIFTVTKYLYKDSSIGFPTLLYKFRHLLTKFQEKGIK